MAVSAIVHAPEARATRSPLTRLDHLVVHLGLADTQERLALLLGAYERDDADAIEALVAEFDRDYTEAAAGL